MISIKGSYPDEYVVQITSDTNNRIHALTNYGNIYYKSFGEWYKVRDIPFEKLNKEKDEEK